MKKFVIAAMLLVSGYLGCTTLMAHPVQNLIIQNNQVEIPSETVAKLVSASASYLDCSEETAWDLYRDGILYFEEIEEGVFRAYQGGTLLLDIIEDAL